MTRPDPYHNLTPEQRAQLKAVVAKLREMPTENLLRESHRLRSIDPASVEGRKQIDAVLASCWAFERLLPYQMALRSFAIERLDIGKQIYEYIQEPYPESIQDAHRKAHAELMASQLSGLQEVVFHFFCITVKHIRTLLTIAAEAAGHALSPGDDAFLDHYRDLRDYYEHFYNRLPGRTHDAAIVDRTLEDGVYRLTAGLNVDKRGCLLLRMPKKGDDGKTLREADGTPIMIEKAFHVTGQGARQVDQIIERNWKQIRRKAVNGLRDYFVLHPEHIPSPDSVRFELMTRPGGPTR